MSSSKTKRESGIELLRIFAILGVVILHYNNPVFGGALELTKDDSVKHTFLMILQSLCIPAVDIFMIISGYFMCGKKSIRIIKPIELLLQVMIFGGLLYALDRLIFGGGFSLKEMVTKMIPANYFVILYIAVYFLSPFINKMIDNVDIRKLFIILIVLFSVYPTLVDFYYDITGSGRTGLSTIGAYGSQRGYTVVNFALMYIVGALIKKAKLDEKYTSKLMLAAAAVVCTGVTLAVSSYYPDAAQEYCNPVVIIQAAAVFLLFRQIRFSSGIVNTLAKGAFTCYLAHAAFIKHIRVSENVSKSIFIMIGHMIVSVIGIYCICFLLYLIWSLAVKLVYRIFPKLTDITLEEK